MLSSVPKEQLWDEVHGVYANCFTSHQGLGLVFPFTVLLIKFYVSGTKVKLDISESQPQACALRTSEEVARVEGWGKK